MYASQRNAARGCIYTRNMKFRQFHSRRQWDYSRRSYRSKFAEGLLTLKALQEVSYTWHLLSALIKEGVWLVKCNPVAKVLEHKTMSLPWHESADSTLCASLQGGSAGYDRRYGW